MNKEYVILKYTNFHTVEGEINGYARDGWILAFVSNSENDIVFVMERDVPEPAQDPKRSTAELELDHFFAAKRLAEVEVMAGQVDDEAELRRDLQEMITAGAIVENADGSFSVADKGQ